MTQINLTAEQTALLSSADGDVVIADSAGNVVTTVSSAACCELSAEDQAIIEDCERIMASKPKWIPSSEVLAKLNRLNEQAKS